MTLRELLIEVGQFPFMFWLIAFAPWIYDIRGTRRTDPEYAALGREFRKWDFAMAVAVLLSLVPVGAALYLPLHLVAHGVASLRRSSSDAGTFVFFADGALLFVPMTFATGAIAQLPAWWAMKRALGERFPEYLRYSSVRHGRNRYESAPKVAGMVLLAALLATLPIIRAGVVASPRELMIRPFTSAERCEHYWDVADIRVAPAVMDAHHRVTVRRVYVVTFHDGSSLQSNYLLDTEIDGRSVEEFLDELSRRSGIPVTRLDVMRYTELY